MDYQDFVLQLDRAPAGQGFITRVIRSPAGEAEAPFVNPVPAEELDDLWRVALATRQASRAAKARNLESTDSFLTRGALEAERSLEDLGDRLFRALFRGSVRSCWAASLAESAQDPHRGLRLKLQLNLLDPLVAPLAELPWEYLYSLDQGGFLGLQRKTPILRHMRLPLPTGRAPVAQSLRVLIVSSQPSTMTHLSLEEEGAKIAGALGALPGVETLPLHNPTIEALRNLLLREDFHVLHFMGHGDFDPESGQGVLYFADADEGEVPVAGTLLASHLTDLPSLRLVFVNACETARSNARAPFAGVATALLRAGLPAVVAMQRPIGDESALEFSRSVYRRLAAGDPIDAAVTEGRLAITRSQQTPLEWGTPVLFLRAEDGRLFAPGLPATFSETPAPDFSSRPAPLSSRSRRPLYLSLSLGCALAISLGTGAARWLHLLEPIQIQADRPAPTTAAPAPKPAGLSPSSPEPARTTRREPAVKVSPAKPEIRQEETRVAPDPIPSRPVPSPSSSYVVSEGSPVSVPGLGAEVGAHFFERAGRHLARFWIAPPGEEILQQPPVIGPGPIDFAAPNGTYHMEVLSLDGAEKRATISLRFLP
jgi:hypothetical protein